jgi:Flp pilus assembly protein TadB
LGVFVLTRLGYVAFFVVALVCLAVAVGVLVLANGDDDEDEDEFGEEALEETAEAAGSAAFALGVLANASFVAYKWLRLHVRIRGSYRSVLNVHIFLNVLLGLLALYHGYYLRSAAGPVEYASILVVLVILASGLLLRYSKDRRLKWFARQLHIQRLLALVLLAVVLIHIYTVED